MDVRNRDRSRYSFGCNALQSPKTALKAFTLVEVALTLGIVTFALIAIFSLISVSLKNSRDANVRQGLTLALDQTISSYQGQNFTNALAMVQAQTNFYFDSGGTSAREFHRRLFQVGGDQCRHRRRRDELSGSPATQNNMAQSGPDLDQLHGLLDS